MNSIFFSNQPHQSIFNRIGFLAISFARVFEIDLNNLPIPIWTPGKDAAPYVTGICIGKNYDSGIQNTAIYRAMVQDQNHLAVNRTVVIKAINLNGVAI